VYTLAGFSLLTLLTNEQYVKANYYNAGEVFADVSVAEVRQFHQLQTVNSAGRGGPKRWGVQGTFQSSRKGKWQSVSQKKAFLSVKWW